MTYTNYQPTPVFSSGELRSGPFLLAAREGAVRR